MQSSEHHPPSHRPRLRLSRSLWVAIIGGLGSAVLVAIALGDSAPWPVKIPVALVGGGTIGLLGAGYAQIGTENEED